MMGLHLFILLAALLGAGKSWGEEKGMPSGDGRPSDPFVYHAENKRNPFQPPTAWLARFFPDQSAASGLTDLPQRRERREKELLESFQMDSLKLVAILFMGKSETDPNASTTELGEPVAMVEDPEGVGHVVRVGSYMGVNEGRVARIAVDELLVEEPAPRQGDPAAVRTITLQLHKTEEPGQDNVSTKTKNQQ
ncbi:MAG: pilus assembly protein PilP [Magnetococcales bacterium]|nr:pilus assembly protein PilP [Magnetococcales bacterium]